MRGLADSPAPSTGIENLSTAVKNRKANLIVTDIEMKDIN